MRAERWGAVRIPDRVATRAVTRYVQQGECQISTYSTMSTGYAQIGWTDGKFHGTTLAHRAAWVGHNGKQIPPGLTVDHSSAAGCTSRRCVRREHLRTLPNLENARRTAGRDWPLGTCRHGHGPEFWRPKTDRRLKGYCAECRRLKRLRNIA